MNLTSREIEILRLVSFEYSTNEIATRLYLSHHTVLSHRKNLLLKMEARNTAGLVRKGFENGYLSALVSSPA